MTAKVQPAKEEWEEIEIALRSPWGRADLNCDGYTLNLRVERDGMRLLIMVYVDGKLKGKWMSEDCDKRQKFFRPVHKFVHSKKIRDGAKKRGNKKLYEELFGDVNKKHTIYYAWWPSFKPLRRHLVANNESIEWVRDEA